MKGKVHRKVRELINLASDYYGYEFTEPFIRWKSRIGFVGGLGRWFDDKDEVYHHEIWFDEDWFSNYPDIYLNDTVPHEVAHYLVSYVFPCKYPEDWIHGDPWLEVMNLFGAPINLSFPLPKKGGV